MITRDYILRQIHQLAQVLAQVLLHKRTGHYEDAQELLDRSVQEVTGVDVDRLRELDRDALLDVCSSEAGFNADLAVALANLLREDETRAGAERALWLYEAALEADGVVLPHDIHQRIADLRAAVEPDERAGRPPSDS